MSTHCRCSRTTSMLPALTLPKGVPLWSWYGSTGSTSQQRARCSPLSGIPNNCVFTTNSVSRKVNGDFPRIRVSSHVNRSHPAFTSHELQFILDACVCPLPQLGVTPATQIPVENRADVPTFASWAAATSPEPAGVLLDTAWALMDSHAKVSNCLPLIKCP